MSYQDSINAARDRMLNAGRKAVDASPPLKIGQTFDLNYAGVPGFFKGQKVTIAEVSEQKWKLPGKFGVAPQRGTTYRYRVTNENGKSAWLEETDLT